MKFFAVPKNGILRLAFSEDADKIGKMKQGEMYRVKVSMPRNARFHRKYFTLINLVFENLPEVIPAKTPDGRQIEIRSQADLLWHIKMQIGHYEQRITLGGKITYEAKSISFGSMDNFEFEEFYSKSIDVVLKYFLPETNRDQLIDVIAMNYV